MIAVTVVITVLVVGKDSGGGESPTPTNGNGSDFASANDKGPVGIITEDPTCDAWGRVAREYSAKNQKAVGTGSSRDQSLPASAWELLSSAAMYDTVGKAIGGRRGPKDGQPGEVTPASRHARTVWGSSSLMPVRSRTLFRHTRPATDDRTGLSAGQLRLRTIAVDMLGDRLRVRRGPIAPLVPEALLRHAESFFAGGSSTIRQRFLATASTPFVRTGRRH